MQMEFERTTQAILPPSSLLCLYTFLLPLFSESHSIQGRMSLWGPEQYPQTSFSSPCFIFSSTENLMEILAESHSSIGLAKEGKVEILFNSFSFSFHFTRFPNTLPPPPPKKNNPPKEQLTNHPNKQKPCRTDPFLF